MGRSWSVVDIDFKKPNIRAKNVLLSISGNMKSVMHYELVNPDKTVTTEYCQQYINRLSDELERKKLFTGSGSRQVILQEDNSQLHTEKGTKNIIYTLSWKVLPYAAHLSDLALSDYIHISFVSASPV